MCGYLVERHRGEQHHHVDDLVHDDGSFEADDEKHPATDVDPVFDQNAHHQAAQNLHEVLLSSLLWFFLLYKSINTRKSSLKISCIYLQEATYLRQNRSGDYFISFVFTRHSQILIIFTNHYNRSTNLTNHCKTG